MLMAFDQSTQKMIELKSALSSWSLFIHLIAKTVLTTPVCCPLHSWNFRFCLAYQQIVVLDEVSIETILSMSRFKASLIRKADTDDT